MNEKTGVCIRQTEIPSSTPLFTDLLYHFDRVRAFYRYPPQMTSVPTAVESISLGLEHRRALVEALRERNVEGGPATASHLDLLAQPKTVVVATGQQVGFYGGPVFTLYKALTAIRLAEELRQKGIPAVAVFWLATEDHDLAEVDHTWIFDEHSEPLKLQADAQAPAGQPVGRVELRDGSAQLLSKALADLPFGKEVEELARAAYEPGASFQSGFSRLYQQLLSPFGLIFLDPMSHAIRRLAAPLWRRALQEAPDLNRELIGRSRALENGGYHAQVHVNEETSLLFLIDQGRRTVLRRTNRDYVGEGTTYSTDQLLQRLEESPQDFSPNALLRPVTQDFLLPTAVYVGGPAELAYLAQAEVLYRRLLGRMPVVVPRASFTILDSRAERLLKRYSLHVTDCFEGPRALRRQIAARLIPPPLKATLGEAEERIKSALEAVHQGLEGFDPTLAAALTTVGKKIQYQFGKIRGKVAQESLRRDRRAKQDAAYLAHLVFPERTLQERLYSVLPFLARHGLDLPERLHAAIQPDCHDHQVWVP